MNKEMSLTNLMDVMNYNFRAKGPAKGPSQLGQIQKQLIDMVANMPQTPTQMEQFQTNLVTNSVIFGEETKRYEGVNTVATYYEDQMRGGMSELQSPTQKPTEVVVAFDPRLAAAALAYKENQMEEVAHKSR